MRASRTLYSVLAFARDRRAVLLSLSTASSRVVWREHAELGLVAVLVTREVLPPGPGRAAPMDVGSGASPVQVPGAAAERYDSWADLALGAAVAVVGRREIGELGAELGGELLRKRLLEAAPLVDAALGALFPAPAEEEPIGTAALRLGGVLVAPRPPPAAAEALLRALQHFEYAVSGRCAFLLRHGAVAEGTAQWWRLTTRERALLALLAAPSCDPTVYVDSLDRAAPFRLLALVLPGSHLACVLCGAEPSVADVEHQVLPAVWGPADVERELECAVDSAGERPRWPAPATPGRRRGGGVAPACDLAPDVLGLSVWHSTLGLLHERCAPNAGVRKALALWQGGGGAPEALACHEHCKLFRLQRGPLRIALAFEPETPTFALQGLAEAAAAWVEAATLFPRRTEADRD